MRCRQQPLPLPVATTYEIVHHFSISEPRSAAVPELGSLGHIEHTAL